MTALYGGLLAVLQFGLSMYVVAGRWGWRIALGDGGNKAMEMRVRVHGNFVEYVPMTLVLLAVNEIAGLPSWFLHAVGAGLLLGRVAHAFGLGRVRSVSVGRFAGMTLTYAALLAAAGGALWVASR